MIVEKIKREDVFKLIKIKTKKIVLPELDNKCEKAIQNDS